ncbi:unnamed protein product [Phytophthora lilii]|uniref:Unnamed protein product n=1 Tax=Phytophthora lilii TaxID=2077276 RepID=A0A9W6WPH0_9STRA|nr:unnamed protein product [Phytophthora lilii]
MQRFQMDSHAALRDAGNLLGPSHCLRLNSNYSVSTVSAQYEPADQRAPDQLTSFEGYGCGGPIGDYYYYYTLVAQTKADGTVKFFTCSKAVRDEDFVLLGGCDVLIRAKDLYIVMGMKLFTERMASTINLPVVLAHIANGHLLPMRRVSYITLFVAKRWNGRISYPDIG